MGKTASKTVTLAKPGFGSKARATRVAAIARKLDSRRRRGLPTSAEKRAAKRASIDFSEIRANENRQAGVEIGAAKTTNSVIHQASEVTENK